MLGWPAEVCASLGPEQAVSSGGRGAGGGDSRPPSEVTGRRIYAGERMHLVSLLQSCARSEKHLTHQCPHTVPVTTHILSRCRQKSVRAKFPDAHPTLKESGRQTCTCSLVLEQAAHSPVLILTYTPSQRTMEPLWSRCERGSRPAKRRCCGGADARGCSLREPAGNAGRRRRPRRRCRRKPEARRRALTCGRCHTAVPRSPSQSSGVCTC